MFIRDKFCTLQKIFTDPDLIYPLFQERSVYVINIDLLSNHITPYFYSFLNPITNIS